MHLYLWGLLHIRISCKSCILYYVFSSLHIISISLRIDYRWHQLLHIIHIRQKQVNKKFKCKCSCFYFLPSYSFCGNRIIFYIICFCNVQIFVLLQGFNKLSIKITKVKLKNSWAIWQTMLFVWFDKRNVFFCFLCII